MAGPWEDYVAQPQQEEPAPWLAYQQPQDQPASAAPIQTSQEMPAMERIPLGLAETAGRGLFAGLGTPGDLESAVLKYGINPLHRLLGQPEENPNNTFFPTSATTLGLANSLGIPEPAPAISLPEKITRGVVGGAASALPIAALAPETMFANPQAFERLVMSGGAGGAASAGTSAALNAMGVPQDSGIRPWLEGGAGVLAGGGIGMRSGRSIADIASDLGSSKTMREAGLSLQNQVQDWVKGLPQRYDELNQSLDDLIPDDATVGPSNTIANAKELLGRGGQAANAVRDFVNGTMKSGGALGQTAKQIQNEISIDGTGEDLDLSWDEARALRSEVGQAASTARASEKPALQFLYKGLTQDLRDTASNHGAGEAFDHYNAESVRLHDLESGLMQNILKKSPEDAASSLLGLGS